MAMGRRTPGKALHSPTPPLIRKYNFERGLRWIKCRDNGFIYGQLRIMDTTAKALFRLATNEKCAEK